MVTLTQILIMNMDEVICENNMKRLGKVKNNILGLP